MKENRKKYLAAAVFFILAGLLFCVSGNQEKTEANDFEIVSESQTLTKGTEEAQLDTDSEVISETATDDSGKVSEPTSDKTVYVYVCGEVQTPGVYALSTESRIFEAIDAAGGFTDQAAKESINLALGVTDGMQITVLNKEEAANFSTAQVTGAAEFSNALPASGRINLNTAAKEELMTLKGIGEAKAEDIIKYRESHGGFQKIEDIMNISGIKEAGFLKIKDQITV